MLFQRVMLLELREEFSKLGSNMMPHIEEVKYNWVGINESFYGGDHRSWQRYTNSLPIDGIIETGGNFFYNN